MTDVENLEKIIFDIFDIKKVIKNKKNSNKCIRPLNRYPLNMFAFNFMNRLSRLKKNIQLSPTSWKLLQKELKILEKPATVDGQALTANLLPWIFTVNFPIFFQLPIQINLKSATIQKVFLH